MALQKTIDSNFGVAANYWKIAYINAHFAFGTMVVGGWGYADAAAKAAGKEPLMSQQFSFEGIGDIESLTRTQVYGLLKQQEMFAGAQDV